MSNFGRNTLIEITETILEKSGLEDTMENWDLVTDRVMTLNGVTIASPVTDFVDVYFATYPLQENVDVEATTAS